MRDQTEKIKKVQEQEQIKKFQYEKEIKNHKIMIQKMMIKSLKIIKMI